MNNTSIQLHDPNINPVDMFFNREPVTTDWDGIRDLVLSGPWTEKLALDGVRDYEPLQEADPYEHNHWVAQQVLRLTLLHQAGQPLEADLICQDCGTRKVDPLYAKKYSQICLHCAEQKRQLPDSGCRGNCEFLRPVYNSRSHSWGLLYYCRHNFDNVFIFWLADYYKTRQEAHRALLPIEYYDDWLNVKYQGMTNYWRSFQRLLPIEEAIKLALPLTPEQLTARLRAAIAEDMKQEHSLLAYCVKEAMDEHRRKDDDE